MEDKIQFMNFRNTLLLYFNGMTKQAGLCGGSYTFIMSYKGADNSLARPGRKQATATEDFDFHVSYLCRSQWPRGLRRRSTAARLLRSWVRIPLGAWKFVCCEYCVLLGRGLCDGLITRPGESYRLWRVVVSD